MGSTGEATDQNMLTPDCSPSTLDFSGNVGLNLELGLATSCCSRLHDVDLYAVGWGEGP